MIRSLFGFSFRNKFQSNWIAKKDALEKEYSQKETNLLFELSKRHSEIEQNLKLTTEFLEQRKQLLEREQKDVEDLEKRISDRKEELASVNHQLKENIRIIEAKARPDKVWESAFSMGFSKAWDMMLPYMTKGMDNIKKVIREEEIENTLPRLNEMVIKKVEDLKRFELRDISIIDAKKREFEIRQTKTSDPDQLKKLQNYIDIINWLMEIRNGN